MSSVTVNKSSRATCLAGRGRPHGFYQSGIVLPVALFVLVAATILTLALVKTNMISLRIGGASVIARETTNTAELLQTGFQRRNPVAIRHPVTGKEIKPDDGKYDRGYTPCSTIAENPDVDKTIFDCRSIASAKLPANTTAEAWAPGMTTPETQRGGCGGAPRSSQPTQTGGNTFNYYQIVTRVENTFYGSWAAAADGLATMLVGCP